MASPFKVLIISEHIDAHIPFVTKHLAVPYTIYDPAIHSLDISFSGAKPEICINDQRLTDIQSIWVRKPSILFGLRDRVASHYYDYCRSALETHVKSLYTLLSDKLWVSDYHALLKAHYKPAQIEAAQKIGFNVPDTLFTSNPDTAKKFLHSHQRVITKTLSAISPANDEGIPLLFLTTDISDMKDIKLSGLSVAPAIFQTAIESMGDIRVTVIGDEVFAAIIQPKKGSKKPKHIKDWYKYDNTYTDGEATTIRLHNLPKDIQNKCLAHARHFNLQFSAIDLVLDREGQYWFLENNPNGQWAYIEEATGQPMGNAMARLLAQS